MIERPILFSGAMVRALLDGRKTETRRVIRGQSPAWELFNDDGDGCPTFFTRTGAHTVVPNIRDASGVHDLHVPHVLEYKPTCPYGGPEDVLWVRETCIISGRFFDGQRSDSYNVTDRDGNGRICQYLASAPDTEAARRYGLRVTPSIFMPRWASRLTLELTGVRVERVQDITEADAKAEGVEPDTSEFAAYTPHKAGFAHLWETLNGPRGHGWQRNSWVWVLTFRRIDHA